MSKLTNDEWQRLIMGIQAAYSVPFIDDITSFIWEAIFCYAKDIPIVDPLTSTRKKLLYDVVDTSNNIGWSAKAIQKALKLPTEFELVIQRADIFKKASSLGYDKLNKDTSPGILGEALLKHWYLKVDGDANVQMVDQKRICILLKSLDRKHYAFLEEDLVPYDSNHLIWEWTDSTKTGLQGRRRSDNFVVYRWYPNQKQFFERFRLPVKTKTFTLIPHRLPLEEVVHLLLDKLSKP